MKTVLKWWAMCAVALLVACGGGEEAAVGPGHYASGVLTGLKAGNSVLISSGPQSVTLTADGTYRFGRFPTGTVYNVTATSANEAQACSVTNGSGQIGDADIDNIVVNCVDTFSIGGSLSGYVAGNGAVQVALNGGAPLSLTADGAFAFGTRLAPGASYNVALASVPETLVCTLTNGSGLVASTDVTSVAVACVPATGSVAFTVSGLSTPDSLTVQLTGSAINVLPAVGRQVSVGGNGSYTFSAAVPVGSTFAVSLATLPTNHNCVVVNGAGTFALPGVSNVRVECQRSTYTIGGSIGLFSGERAVIALYDEQENQVDSVEVSRPPTSATFDTAVAVPFTFTQRFNSGFGYFIVVVVPPPGDPQYDEKNCTGTNTNGAVDGADVNNISITCGYF